MLILNGYIILSQDCTLALASELTWGGFEYEPNPYVFSSSQIDKIRNSGAKKWLIQPVYMKSAVWDDENGTTVLGHLEAFWPTGE